MQQQPIQPKEEYNKLQKYQWLQLQSTNEHLKTLDLARIKLLIEAEELAGKGLNNLLIETKLIQSRTIRKIIEYAKNIDITEYIA